MCGMTRRAHCDSQERVALGVDNELPAHFMETVSNTYVGLAEKITGQVSPRSQPPTYLPARMSMVHLCAIRNWPVVYQARLRTAESFERTQLTSVIALCCHHQSLNQPLPAISDDPRGEIIACLR